MIQVDERMKHRIVGIIVILSIGVMFLPAILKRTQQPFDHLSRVAVRLPQKPTIEATKIKDEAALFRAVQASNESTQTATVSSVFEETSSIQSVIPQVPKAKTITQQLKQPIVVVKHQLQQHFPSKTNTLYAVQVASFASLNNAQAMISRLKAKGYPVNYVSVRSRNGQLTYKVLVGRALRKDDILKLKKELATRMEIYGFVVSSLG